MPPRLQYGSVLRCPPAPEDCKQTPLAPHRIALLLQPYGTATVVRSISERVVRGDAMMLQPLELAFISNEETTNARYMYEYV